ncbi:hypothetical protein DAPPUDRAFT_308868 [Daphnia pulex]|uniref:Uncharacterized protein n=1 Tax=Daphnia pulex TaxID=6669 RepID=E9HA06_DAPPU|nr:hypothetical protein DAPPUDRAFT_308868 [Daphnia pulex]|eukprot:EFX71343.1 hypothetical protein DAPPUDRAFT_308868 [Daphnia pulex]
MPVKFRYSCYKCRHTTFHFFFFFSSDHFFSFNFLNFVKYFREHQNQQKKIIIKCVNCGNACVDVSVSVILYSVFISPTCLQKIVISLLFDLFFFNLKLFFSFNVRVC